MPPPLEPRPPRELRLVFRPEQDATYRHFAHAADAPFAPDAPRVTRANAWWLADAALLSYWDPAIAIPRFRAAGLDAELDEAGGVQAYVAWSPAAAIVVFRGTEPDEWSDVFDDARFTQTAWTPGPGLAHKGFVAALDRLWPSLAPRLDTLAATRPVWFAGHSLGAALATLAAARCPHTAGVVTLGSPRVGDSVFAEHYDARFGARALRYVNGADLVTHVPPPVPFPSVYTHCGQLRQIDADGAVGSEPPRLDHFVRDVFADTHALLEMVQALRAGLLTRPPKLLLDHMPRGYAVDIWNDFARHGD